MNLYLCLFITLTTVSTILAKIDPVLYCDICRAVISEARVKISKINPDRKTRITEGQGRLTSDGSLKTKSKLIPITQSREWLEELFDEEVCKSVAEDYIKWFDGKDHKQWRIGRVMTYDNKMNTNVDLGFLQSGQGDAREIVEKDPNDRTRTIRWYCENAVELMEDVLYHQFLNINGKIERNPSRMCFEKMEWCQANNISEDFTDEHMAMDKSKKDEL